MNVYKKLDADDNPTGGLILEENLKMLGILDLNPEALAIDGYCHFDNNLSPDRVMNPLKVWKITGYQKRAGDPWDGWFENVWSQVDRYRIDSDGNEIALTQAEKDDIMATVKNIQQKVIRDQRDYLLGITDWRAISDTADMSDNMTEWRQALRDITTHAGYDTEYPEKNIVWPELNHEEAQSQIPLMNFDEDL
jgi:hypothetical protein